jgi:hypothetical protein
MSHSRLVLVVPCHNRRGLLPIGISLLAVATPSADARQR